MKAVVLLVWVQTTDMIVYYFFAIPGGGHGILKEKKTLVKSPLIIRPTFTKGLLFHKKVHF